MSTPRHLRGVFKTQNGTHVARLHSQGIRGKQEIMKRQVILTVPACCSLNQLGDALMNSHERLTEAERAAWDAECTEWRQEQALLAMPIANGRIN
jgi:hypothetical protein